MFKHLAWPLTGFDADFVRHHKIGTRYPMRFLRYWFPRQILERMHAATGKKLSVLEVGVARGKMVAFMGGPKLSESHHALPPFIERWDALDVVIIDDVMRKYSYTDAIKADIEQSVDLKGREYDAVILLHTLEHLFDPEAAMLKLAKSLRKGGVIIGGSPTMPSFFAQRHQAWLRGSKFKNLPVDRHRHLSVITPGRILDFARKNGFEIDLLTGTFFCRCRGIPPENTKLWVRANLLWGALFPSLGGEVYFSLRKP